jgi:hypothetical protein
VRPWEKQELENWKLENNAASFHLPVSVLRFLASIRPALCTFRFPQARGYANFNGNVGAST